MKLPVLFYYRIRNSWNKYKMCSFQRQKSEFIYLYNYLFITRVNAVSKTSNNHIIHYIIVSLYVLEIPQFLFLCLANFLMCLYFSYQSTCLSIASDYVYIFLCLQENSHVLKLSVLRHSSNM